MTTRLGKFERLTHSTWFWLAAFLLLFAGMGALLSVLEGEPATQQPASTPLQYHEKEAVRAWNQWMDHSSNHSPASPDYLQRVSALWLYYEVGEKMRKFEREMMVRAEKEREQSERLD